MARSKPTPERSKIARGRPTAFARRQRSAGEPADDDEDDTAAVEKNVEAKPEEKQADAKPADAAQAPAAAKDKDKDKDLPEIEPPQPKGEPWPDATPAPMPPVEPRAKTETAVMPAVQTVGRPPDMPRTTAPPPLALGPVENPAHMPGPREIPGGNPEDPAPAPGTVPKGDSRSLRRGKDFALIYRVATFVISRFGAVGTRGQWRVVEYPTSSAASHAYAKECSRFVSEGFSDYRE